jgi:hypothetical protein
VFALTGYFAFSVLQSSPHEGWARKYGSTLESRHTYTPTDVFDTFPFPQEPPAEAKERAESAGALYYEHRQEIMVVRKRGLTKTYNLFHDRNCTDADIQRLRELHRIMDRAVLACYGWTDIDPGHGVYQKKRARPGPLHHQPHRPPGDFAAAFGTEPGGCHA